MNPDDFQELTPIVSIDGDLLKEGKDFELTKHEDRTLDIFYHKKKTRITISPEKEGGLLLPSRFRKPGFAFDGRTCSADSYTVMSHMAGKFPGVTIRFLYGAPIKMLQLIPRVVDKRIERNKRQLKDWEHGMSHGFDMDYFKEYGIGTTTTQEDKIIAEQEAAAEENGN